MSRRQSAAFIAAQARLKLLLEQTVPEGRRTELAQAVAQYVAAAVRDDRQHVAAQAVEGESRAIFEEIFGDAGIFERIFGKSRLGR